MNKKIQAALIRNSSALALLTLFATVPLPGFEGNPTGFKYFHDHSIRYIVNNTQAISTVREEGIQTTRHQSAEMRNLQLEGLILQVESSDDLSEDQKNRMIRGYQEKLKENLERLRKYEDRLDHLESSWANYGIAKNP